MTDRSGDGVDRDAEMFCRGCETAHAEWADAGTAPNYDGRTTLDLWDCERCGYTLEGVKL